MIIARRTVYCVVDRATHTELAWLEGQLTYTQGSGYNSKSVCHLRKSKKGERFFGSGFIRSLIRAAREGGLSFQVNDMRVRPGQPAPVKTKLLHAVPHYFQVEAAEALLKAEHGVCELPTGSGKTLVATLLVEALRGLRVLYAVGDAVLAAKTAQTITKELGIKVSGDPIVGTVVSVTLQKLYVMLQRNKAETLAALKRFDAVIIDECHGIPAVTVTKVCSAIPAFFRFGLSATPFERSDNKSAPLLALFGGLVYRKTEGELSKEIDPVTGRTYLPRAEIKMVRFQQAPIFLGRWPKAYETQVVKSVARNDLIADMATAAKKPCLVLFSALSHGSLLKMRMDAAGFRCERVDAKASTAQRLDVIRRLNSGEIDIVVASRVFNVGIDVPELRSVVIAGAMQSAVQTVQRVGRGMRSTKTKRSFEVWDVLDISVNFSKARGAWVARHANQRLKTYRKRGHDVMVGDAPAGPWVTFAGLAPKKRAPSKAQVQASETP